MSSVGAKFCFEFSVWHQEQVSYTTALDWPMPWEWNLGQKL